MRRKKLTVLRTQESAFLGFSFPWTWCCLQWTMYIAPRLVKFEKLCLSTWRDRIAGLACACFLCDLHWTPSKTCCSNACCTEVLFCRSVHGMKWETIWPWIKRGLFSPCKTRILCKPTLAMTFILYFNISTSWYFVKLNWQRYRTGGVPLVASHSTRMRAPG